MLINDSATASPNPHEHYAAINQAVMDKVWVAVVPTRTQSLSAEISPFLTMSQLSG